RAARAPRPASGATQPVARCREGGACSGPVRPHPRGVRAPVLRRRHPGYRAVPRGSRLDRDRARRLRGPDRAGRAVGTRTTGLNARKARLEGRTISGMTALGVSLLIVGAILILIEAHVPTLGALGAPGVVALGAGAVLAVLGLGGGVVLGVIA